MAYRYCHQCGCAIERPPTIQEDLRDGFFCPDCGVQQPQDKSNVDWLIYLWELSLMTPGHSYSTGIATGVGESTAASVGAASSTGDASAVGEEA